MKTRRGKTRKPRRHKAPTAARYRGPSAAGLDENVALLTRERDEALEQQAATSEILRVISLSPADVQPVFNTIAESAVRLCKAQFCELFLRDGEVYRLSANHGFSPEHEEYIRQHPIPLDRGSCTGRTALERRVVHTARFSRFRYCGKARRAALWFCDAPQWSPSPTSRLSL
jgi:hypothetical protein